MRFTGTHIKYNEQPEAPTSLQKEIQRQNLDKLHRNTMKNENIQFAFQDNIVIVDQDTHDLRNTQKNTPKAIRRKSTGKVKLNNLMPAENNYYTGYTN